MLSPRIKLPRAHLSIFSAKGPIRESALPKNTQCPDHGSNSEIPSEHKWHIFVRLNLLIHVSNIGRSVLISKLPSNSHKFWRQIEYFMYESRQITIRTLHITHLSEVFLSYVCNLFWQQQYICVHNFIPLSKSVDAGLLKVVRNSLDLSIPGILLQIAPYDVTENA